MGLEQNELLWEKPECPLDPDLHFLHNHTHTGLCPVLTMVVILLPGQSAPSSFRTPDWCLSDWSP